MVEKDLWPIQSKLIEIINKFKVPFEMKLSDKAKERWKEVYENFSKDTRYMRVEDYLETELER